jgi:cereblon
MAQNLTELSFWIAASLPIDDVTKLDLLVMNCPEQRLRTELDILRNVIGVNYSTS